MKRQGHESATRASVDKGLLTRFLPITAKPIISEQRLAALAALAAKVQRVNFHQAKAPRAVIAAIKGLNEAARLAAGSMLGHEGAEQEFRRLLAGSGQRHVDHGPGRARARGSRMALGQTALAGVRRGAVSARPCGDVLGGAEQVMQAAFLLDVRAGDRLATRTNEAGAFLTAGLRTVGNFENYLGRDAGGPGRLPPGGLGNPDEPPGGADPGLGDPTEPIFPPNGQPPLPDPPPDPAGLGPAPGWCQDLGELCVTLLQESMASFLSDPYADLIASVEPDCLCHDYDPNQEFVARPAQGREFDVPLPADVRLFFRGVNITDNIIHPVRRQELRFRIPPNSTTGYVRLHGVFPAAPARAGHLDRLCGMAMPDFPVLPEGGGVLISIIYRPVIDTLTAQGSAGPVVEAEMCHPLELCWQVHLEDQEPGWPIPRCGRIDVIVRNQAGDTVAQGGARECQSLTARENETFTLEARSFAGDAECGSAGPVTLTVLVVARVHLLRDVPAGQQLSPGSSGSFFVEISCPAPAGGVEVTLASSRPEALQTAERVLIPEGQVRVRVDFTSNAEARGWVEIRADALRHEEARLAYVLERSAAEVCSDLETRSASEARANQSWSNFGIIDSLETLAGFLPAPRLFRPTNLYEIAQAVRRAETDGKTIRALGSGWSFSDAALPQEAPIVGVTQADEFKASALKGETAEADLHRTVADDLAPVFAAQFGYAIDTAALDGNLQALLPEILNEDRAPEDFFFVEAGMTINFLNTLLDAQPTPRALKTMGGASAQSIAGAISTGTHGGDWELRPLADNVRALYLIGQGGVHHWIEPADHITNPAKLQALFPCLLADNIHYDDARYRAALVSMGAMGVIYAVILDVVPQYSLLQWNKWSTWEQLRQETPDLGGLFNGTWTGLAPFLAAHPEIVSRSANRFVQVVINPILNKEETHNCYVSNRVQLDRREPSGVKPIAEFSEVSVHDMVHALLNAAVSEPLAYLAFIDFANAFLLNRIEASADFEGVQKLLQFCKDGHYPWMVHALIDLFMQKSFPLADPQVGFGPTGPQIDLGFKVMAPAGTKRSVPTLGGTAIEAALDFPNALPFIDALLALFDRGVDRGVFPAGWLSLRVTGRTTALLGMQQFDRTATVEMSLIGRPDGYGTVIAVEALARIHGAALHWGESNGMIMPADLVRFYGNPALASWRAHQRFLGGATFTNRLVTRCGL